MKKPFLRLVLSSAAILQLAVCLSQVETYRPDLVWAVGQDQSTFDCFGMNQIRFDSGSVEVLDLDSLGLYSFASSNIQYHHPEILLLANSYLLSRGYSDSVLTLLGFDTDPFRSERSGTGTFGAQAILTVGESNFVYLGETIFMGDLNSDFWFLTPGFSAAFLNLDSLLNNNSTPLARASFFVNTGDTLIERLFDHIAHPVEGWWGVSKSAVSNRLVSWRVLEDSVLLMSPQEVGLPGFRREAATLDLAFRPNGDAFAISGSDHGLDLYFFDRNDGMITLWDEIDGSFDPDFEPYINGTRCEWSADGRYLYVTTETNLFQFDTEAADIGASAVQINEPDDIPFRGTYYQIERGPDCRLYVARSGTGKTLSVIDKPSRPGRACELKDSGLLLPNYYFVSIPEFPEYSLWAKDRVARGLAPIIDTAVCDSSIQAYDYYDWTTSTSEVLAEAEKLVISPNPARSGVVITLGYDLPQSLHSELTSPLSASLFSIDGKQLGNLEIISVGEQEASVQLPTNMPKGMYRLLITSATRPLLEGKVVVQ